MNTVKIYTLSDPISGEIRYVGKTIEDLNVRLSRHVRRRDNTYKSNWIFSLKKIGLIPKIELLDECLNEDWQWVEKYWISQLKSWNINLTNICEGGRGSDGLKHKQDSIEKISKASKGNKYRLGKTFSIESKNKIRLGNLNKKISAESINKMILSKTGKSCGVGRTHSDEHKNNIIVSMIRLKGRKVSQYDLSMNLVMKWDSISLAAKSLNIANSNIVNVCNGKRKTAKNFIWRYS